MLAPMGGLVRLLTAAMCGVWLALSSAAAECVPPPELTEAQANAPAEYALGSTRSDRLGRVIAPVSVNGQGPFRFIVDTGANRSVLSQQLAEQLGLTSTSTGEVHSVLDVTSAPFVQVDSLRYQNLALGSRALPMLQGSFLAGEQGVLGVDSMRGRRLRIDFVRNCIEIIPAQGAPRLMRDWTTVRGQLRFGHLVVIPARVANVDVNLFLDTGSNQTLANPALQAAVIGSAGQRASVEERTVAYTAGRPVVLENEILVPRMRIGARGEITLRHVTAYVGPFHIFELWGLQEQPAMLIGMDVLAQTRELAIDYERAIVQFRFYPPDTPSVSFLQEATRTTGSRTR